MNHREPSHGSTGGRRALHCLALILPFLAPKPLSAALRLQDGLGLPSGCPEHEPNAYLPVLGAPPLRFAEVAPPPDLVSRPPAAAPPQPALSMTESSVALANAAAAQSTVVHSAPPFAPNSARAESASPDKSDKPAPTPILPDEIHPQVRPEDFLPFFQIPGSATGPRDVTVVVPVPRTPAAPATLAPSSATYTETQQ